MMFAIYQRTVFILGDDLNECVLLDRVSGKEVQRVSYGADTLIVDPTDDQIDAADAGAPIPPESCAICHSNPHHEHEWRFRTRDGYGVCDDCGRNRKKQVLSWQSEQKRRRDPSERGPQSSRRANPSG